MITQEEALRIFDYNPDNGEFRWKVKISKSVTVGKVAGCLVHRGYYRVSAYSNLYYVHRIIWLMVTGRNPKEIDHINHNPSDNRLTNLREVDRAKNMQNQTLSSANKSGTTGVIWHKRAAKWMAYITTNGESHYLGLFVDLEEAISARAMASRKYQFHKNHGAKGEVHAAIGELMQMG